MLWAEPTGTDRWAIVRLQGAAGTGSAVDVTDGSTTVTSASEINFTSGAVVANLGGGVAGVAITPGAIVFDQLGGTVTTGGAPFSQTLGTFTTLNGAKYLVNIWFKSSISVSGGLLAIGEWISIDAAGSVVTIRGVVNGTGYLSPMPIAAAASLILTTSTTLVITLQGTTTGGSSGFSVEWGADIIRVA